MYTYKMVSRERPDPSRWWLRIPSQLLHHSYLASWPLEHKASIYGHLRSGQLEEPFPVVCVQSRESLREMACHSTLDQIQDYSLFTRLIQVRK